MKQILEAGILTEVSRQVAGLLGLHFPRPKWQTLEQAICKAAQDLDYQTPKECACRFIAEAPPRELLETMTGYLTVGETYFLRESHSFEIMEQEIIPQLIRTRTGKERRLRIWSAGCASGEEAYTIAILLRKMADFLQGWEISILATDVNLSALRKAVEGVYTEWSFRNIPRWFREGYFSKAGKNRYELNPEIRKMVTFSCLNLAEDSYPSLCNNTNAMDMIFCRNVLMYFTPERAEKVIERLHLSLVDGGWLFVSPCETSPLLAARFSIMNYGDAIIYRKSAINAEVQALRDSAPEAAPLPGQPPLPMPGKSPQAQTRHEPAPPPPTAPDEPARLSPYEEALALYQQGLYGQAAELLRRMLSEDGGNAAALTLLCRVHANEGRLGEALRLSELAVAADKLNAGIHCLHAVILQEQGDLDGAVAALKRALYLDSELVIAHFSLGTIALRQGKARESRRSFDNALALLKKYAPDETVPESEGMLAGRLKEIIQTATGLKYHSPQELASHQEKTALESRSFMG